jgi:hypothetical protein
MSSSGRVSAANKGFINGVKCRNRLCVCVCFVLSPNRSAVLLHSSATGDPTIAERLSLASYLSSTVSEQPQSGVASGPSGPNVVVQVDLCKFKPVLRKSFGDLVLTSFTSVALGVKFHVTFPLLFLILC